MEYKFPKFWFVLFLVLGFFGLCLPNFLDISWGEGICAAFWMISFLCLTCGFRSRRETIITGVVFIAGYLLRYWGTLTDTLPFMVLFLLMALLQFGVLLLYSRILHKWDHIPVTLAFPLLWLALYLLATAVRFPTLVRVDVMFADMNVLLQLEDIIGSYGLSFLLLWIMALLSYAISHRKHSCAAACAWMYIFMLLFGTIYLYPNLSSMDCVRIAYSTGPYVGDYLNYSRLPTEYYLQSMRTCVSSAAQQGAGIIVFNEETYEIDDTEEESFLAECRKTAKENSIHMLVGFDVQNTNGGKCENKLYWIDQNGEVLGSYLKTKTIPILEAEYKRGDGNIPCHTITVGDSEIKVSYLICYDSNFSSFVHSMDDDTDILFLPSWDWPAVTELHAQLCKTIAVENRVNIVKSTYDGTSIVVRSDGAIIQSSNTDETGYEAVIVVDVPVEERNILTAAQRDKSSFTYMVIAVEIFSMLLCLVLLYGNMFESRERTPRNKLYSIMAMTIFVALGVDAASWVLDGCERLNSVLYGTTLLSNALSFFVTGEFLYYIIEYIREKKPIPSTCGKIYMGYTVFISAIMIITIYNGGLFTINNGVYEDGPLYGVYIVANLLSIVYCLYLNLANRDVLTPHDRIASLLYVLFPFISAIINLFVEEFSFAYPASALSLTAIYIMIQAERENRLKEQSVLISHRATHDVLTGLLNRLAYEEKLKEVSRSDGMVGVVFTDMNGLKYINDHYGHEKGDRLLIRYAELLSRHFRKEMIYRISGDEFTVILPDVSREAFQKRIDLFLYTIHADSIPLACVGFEYGKSRNVNELIKTAESDMYEEKTKFHDVHPELTRT